MQITDSVALAFLSSGDDLLTILRRRPGPHPPIEQAMLLLEEHEAQARPAQEVLEAAQAVAQDGQDPVTLVLFLTLWARTSIRTGRLDEANALLRRARSLLPRDAPPELRAHLTITESILANVSGDKARREELLRAALGALPPDSPHRKYAVMNLALFLAQLGRADEVDADLAWLAGQPGRLSFAGIAAAARFFNCVEAGRAEEAARQAPEAEKEPGFITHSASARERYTDGLLLLGLLRGRRPSPGPGRAPPWALSSQALLERNPQEALRWARADPKAMDDGIRGSGFAAYSLLRAELACRNPEAAARLLTLRERAGNRHWLDGMFLARSGLLMGDKDMPARLFQVAVENARRFRSEGRLELELRMACELTPMDLVRMIRAPEQPDAIPSPPGPPRPREGMARLLGSSPAMDAVREAVARFAAADASLLVTGETGTGKELVARALHESGPRERHPFVAINCGAVAESLLESELFGHEKGAFTGAVRPHKGLFEEAGEGTLFLDEIGEISPRLQHALLRVLESGEIRPVGGDGTRRIRCRVLAATNADLEALVERGAVRQDLSYRLRRLEIHIPPLRERPEDIPELARHFLNLGRQEGVRATLSPELEDRLRGRPWPGNVRELANEIERMRLMHSDKLHYALEDLERLPARPRRSPPRAPPPAAGREVEEEVLREGRSRLRRLGRLRALFARHGTLTRAEIARILGVSPMTVTADLKILCREGAVRKVEPGPSPRSHYFVHVAAG